jgi:hypothetical protein
MLSIIGLFVFIWSMRRGLLVEESERGLDDLRAWRDRPD